MAIETDRLLLRKPILEDFEGYWQMKNDIAGTLFTGGVTPYGHDERLAMFKEEWVDADINTEFSVVLKASGDYLGYCGIIDENGLTHELLYGFKRSAWGMGYGSEAAAAILNYGFSVLKIPYIAATVDPRNVASERIIQKIGMAFDRSVEKSGIPLHKYRIDRAVSGT